MVVTKHRCQSMNSTYTVWTASLSVKQTIMFNWPGPFDSMMLNFHGSFPMVLLDHCAISIETFRTSTLVPQSTSCHCQITRMKNFMIPPESELLFSAILLPSIMTQTRGLMDPGRLTKVIFFQNRMTVKMFSPMALNSNS